MFMFYRFLPVWRISTNQSDRLSTPPPDSVNPNIESGVWRMSRLTEDGTAESVSRDETLRREQGQGNTSIVFPYSADHEQDWQPYRLIYNYVILVCDNYTYIHTTTTATLSTCYTAWGPRKNPSLPDSRLRFFSSRCNFSTLHVREHLVNQWLILPRESLVPVLTVRKTPRSASSDWPSGFSSGNYILK